MNAGAARRTNRLYWSVQTLRNRGVTPLFVVVASFVAAYAYLFPGLLTVSGVSKLAQNWFPRRWSRWPKRCSC
jgi:ribose transport system permease protein